MVLDIPVADRGEPAERPPSMGHDALAAIEQRPRRARQLVRLLLSLRATQLEDR
jgi:hypothetical protein